MTEYTRYRCTKENPWHKGIVGPSEHEGAYEVGEQEDGWPSGDLVRMRCPNCGVEWTKELPQ